MVNISQKIASGPRLSLADHAVCRSSSCVDVDHGDLIAVLNSRRCTTSCAGISAVTLPANRLKG
jgi:hypothetical protein